MDLFTIKMLILAGLAVVFVLTIWLAIWLFGIDHPAAAADIATNPPAEPEVAKTVVPEVVPRGR